MDKLKEKFQEGSRKFDIELEGKEYYICGQYVVEGVNMMGTPLLLGSLGFIIRSAGENQEAVDVAGISVNEIRFGTIAVSGVLCGIAGAFYTLGYLGMFTTSIIGGRGWIAFAIYFLVNWSPLN